MNTAPKAAGLELHLGLGRAIGAVAEHICRRVALGQERVERLAVVDRRIGHLVAPDQLVLGVRIHVVLVAKEALALLLRPAGVAVLLAQFGGLLLPVRRCLPNLYGFVLVTAVALLRHRHDRGINHLPATRHVALRRKVLVETFEQFLNQRSPCEFLAEQSQRRRVRKPATSELFSRGSRVKTARKLQRKRSSVFYLGG